MRRVTSNSREALHLEKILSVAVVGTALLLVLPTAQAETLSPSPQGQTPSVTAPNQTSISDQKLGQAAAAMEQVASLRQTYQQQLSTASESDKPRITGEANQAIAKAVTDQGLSVDEYNGILRAAQSNPTVRDGLIQHLNLQSGQPAQSNDSGTH